ncbi:hypothetical protein [Pseudomonas fluorescens]|uniref:hypothetical protein n=1 Tax=Pseudomonas fluorescens TaxID=294 RepID=UPI00123FCF7B|nr:hypothetical protein [Pseudomonas fluorescens]
MLAIAVHHSTVMSADTPQSPVGAGLLAMAVHRSKVMSADTPQSPVGAGLLAMAVHRSKVMSTDTPQSPASRLLKGRCSISNLVFNHSSKSTIAPTKYWEFVPLAPYLRHR